MGSPRVWPQFTREPRPGTPEELVRYSKACYDNVFAAAGL